MHWQLLASENVYAIILLPFCSLVLCHCGQEPAAHPALGSACLRPHTPPTHLLLTPRIHLAHVIPCPLHDQQCHCKHAAGHEMDG